MPGCAPRWGTGGAPVGHRWGTEHLSRITPLKFTKSTVTALKPEERRRFYDEDSLPGFRLVVSPNGTKTFVVRIRTGSRENRRERTLTIGRFGVLTVEQAREQAPGISRKLISLAAFRSQLAVDETGSVGGEIRVAVLTKHGGVQLAN